MRPYVTHTHAQYNQLNCKAYGTGGTRPKFSVQVTGTSNFANMSGILVPDLSDTRNLDEELGCCTCVPWA